VESSALPELPDTAGDDKVAGRVAVAVVVVRSMVAFPRVDFLPWFSPGFY
jgi:hypothetical protein